jgi:hypothetical protein
MSTFEDRLWAELVREHGDQLRAHDRASPLRRRHTRRPAVLSGAAALAAAGLIAAAVLAFTGTTAAPPAYAVTSNPDGSVTVTLNDISGVTALNAELARDGIAARAIPLTAGCPIHGFVNPMPSATNPSTYTITIVPREIPPGYTAVLAAGQNASGRVELLQGALPGPLPACFNRTSKLVPLKR